MALVELGPLVHRVSGRIGRMLFRDTRWGTVAQSMHPVRTTVTDRETLVRARFAIAVRTWAIMNQPIKDTLIERQEMDGHGIPGPWIGALLHYLDGDGYSYRHASIPAVSPRIISIVETGPTWKITLDQAPVAPFTNMFLLFFPSSVITTHVPAWSNAPWSSPVIEAASSLFTLADHLLILPNAGYSTGITGVPDCRPIPYP